MTGDANTILCASCCAESPAGKRFCGECGTELAAGGVVGPVDEIRVATVLFADVADFTKLSAQLGLEAIKSLMDKVFDRLYQVLVQHGGVVDKYIGDCVMALFGAPISHGDDATRAVRAGLEMQRELKGMRTELARQGLPEVDMRIGINTGPVIAGAVGAGPQRRYTVMGHTVNVAAHLQRAVPRGTVAISEGTYGRVRGLYNLRLLPGIDPPAHEVLSHRFGGLWLRPREILGAEVAMVGRSGELQQLLDLAQVSQQASKARLALVVGEPGVGKTRVSAEFLAQVEQRSDEPPVRIIGFADPFSASAPFSVAADVLRRKFEITAEQPPEEVLARLRRVLLQLGCDLVSEDDAVLARILGLADPAPRPAPRRVTPPTQDTRIASPEQPRRPPRLVDPAQFAQRATHLLVDVVDRLTQLSPVVAVIEDLQWCDPFTLALIDRVLDQLSQRPLMIVGLARPEFFAEHPGALSHPPHLRLDLSPLGESEVAELLERALGPKLRQRLLGPVSSALGNPFHVEELLRTLEDRGVLVRQVDGWRLGPVPEELGLPPQVEAVAQVRIDNLSPSQRALLRNAALIGRSFWDGALRAVTDDFSASDLSTLVRRELVVHAPESRFAGQREYRFLHEVARQVAYRMLPDSMRTQLHRKVASWLQAQGATTAEELALVGMHLERGGEPEGAAEHLQNAGDAAYQGAAYGAALKHFSRAIELTDSTTAQFGLLARRERVFNALGRWSEQQKDATRLLELAVGEDERRMEALLRNGRAMLNLGNHQQAKQAFEEALRLARQLDLPEGAARSLRWLGMYHFNRSQHPEALPLFTEALRIAEGSGLDRLAAELAYELGVTVGTVGDYVQALDVSQRALEMFREQGNRYQEAFCLGNLGCFHVYLGEYEQAVEALQRSAQLGRQMGIPLAEASAQANLGNAFRQMKQPDRALELEHRARTVARRIGDVRLDADACLYGSLAALDLGRTDEAERLLGEAQDLAHEADMVGTRAVALMVRARAELDAGRVAAAVDAADQAVAILERTGSVEGFEAEIRLVHAKTNLKLGRRDAACRSLDRATQDLLRKASGIQDSNRRRLFLERVPANAEIMATAQKVGVDDQLRA